MSVTRGEGREAEKKRVGRGVFSKFEVLSALRSLKATSFKAF